MKSLAYNEEVIWELFSFSALRILMNWLIEIRTSSISPVIIDPCYFCIFILHYTLVSVTRDSCAPQNFTSALKLPFGLQRSHFHPLTNRGLPQFRYDSWSYLNFQIQTKRSLKHSYCGIKWLILLRVGGVLMKLGF